jgi:hypothetical protein
MDQEIFTEKERQTFDALVVSSKPFLREQERHDVLRPPGFNIFHVLGQAYRETSTHSALLAHLLDSSGSHGQEGAFLSLFFEMLVEVASCQHKKLSVPCLNNPQMWSCRKEAFADGLGQIDILLRHREHLIVIENKIYAGDQKDQLFRYRKFAISEMAKNNLKSFLILYLTPDGSCPTAYSLGEWKEPRNELLLLSYRNDIVEFLDKSIKFLSTDKAISLREILFQYKALVRSLK